MLALTSVQDAALAQLVRNIREHDLPSIIASNGLALRISPALCVGLRSIDISGVADSEDLQAMEQFRAHNEALRAAWLSARERRITQAVEYLETAMGILKALPVSLEETTNGKTV